MMPSAYHVAIAIYAAAREIIEAGNETDIADPGRLALIAANGTHDEPGRLRSPFNRTRLYAAVALSRVFPETPQIAIGRMVSATSPHVWMAKNMRRLRNGDLPWYNGAIADRIADAVRWALVREPLAPDADAAPVGLMRPEARPAIIRHAEPGRPAASERQIRARDMLAEAMRNTVAMQKKTPGP